MKILVTGGAGFIGSALTRALCAADCDVTVLDDFSRGRADRLEGSGATVAQGDVRSFDDIRNAMHGASLVIHLAYLQGTQTFYSDPYEVLDVGLDGILNLVRACEAEACTEMLLVSSSEAYQVAVQVPTPETVPLSVPDITNPRYSYGVGKIASEAFCMAAQRRGVLDRLVIARPHNIIGPDMGFEHVIPEFCLRMNDLVRDYPTGVIPFPIQGTGQETRSFCYIDDCVHQLTALALSGAGGWAADGVYHIGVMDERTIEDVAHEVAACYMRKIKVVPGTLPKGSPPRRLPDTRKITELLLQGGLDNAATVPFSLAIARTVDWYRRLGREATDG